MTDTKTKRKIKWTTRQNGEKIELDGEHYFKCCGCGLVHRAKFRHTKDGKIIAQFWALEQE